jgi:hypothetical protein
MQLLKRSSIIARVVSAIVFETFMAKRFVVTVTPEHGERSNLRRPRFFERMFSSEDALDDPSGACSDPERFAVVV